ncbi:MAG: hypothetical protein ACI4I6_04665 [Hominimerdicola sp.]
MKEARKNVAWYIKGLKGSAKLRGECGNLSELKDLDIMIEKIKAENQQ